jgi:hypothetical protein
VEIAIAIPVRRIFTILALPDIGRCTEIKRKIVGLNTHTVILIYIIIQNGNEK